MFVKTLPGAAGQVEPLGPGKPFLSYYSPTPLVCLNTDEYPLIELLVLCQMN